MPQVFEHARQHGYRLIPGTDLAERGLSAVLDEVHATLSGRPVYFCFDMDVFDPSRAPDVHARLGRRLGARGLALLQGVAGLNLVACDVNTVSPPHDVGGMTAFLAATAMLQCLLRTVWVYLLL